MKTKALILTSLFAALTAIGALISIPLPFSPVPITLQVLFSLMAGLILGKYYGSLSQLIYLLLGGIGLPVFAGGRAGFQNLIGPTAGYLWGFVLAAYVIGLIAEQRPTLTKDLLALFIGLLVIYLPGTYILHRVAAITLSKAFTLGVLPFIPGDLAKLAVAAFVVQRIRHRIPELSLKN